MDLQAIVDQILSTSPRPSQVKIGTGAYLEFLRIVRAEDRNAPSSMTDEEMLKRYSGLSLCGVEVLPDPTLPEDKVELP